MSITRIKEHKSDAEPYFRLFSSFPFKVPDKKGYQCCRLDLYSIEYFLAKYLIRRVIAMVM
jgi:hypothetical protein